MFQRVSACSRLLRAADRDEQATHDASKRRERPGPWSTSPSWAVLCPTYLHSMMDVEQGADPEKESSDVGDLGVELHSSFDFLGPPNL